MPQQTKIILGTATPGGGFPVYGAAVVEVVNAADASLLLQPQNTKGSTENLPLLEAALAAPRKELIHPGVLRYLREIGLVA